jgi:hypothetical protein
MIPVTHPLAVDAAAHVVQLALTPIFLLTGIASLLNVFSTRLGRIADQVDKLDSETSNSRRLARLRLRSRLLDIAVLLAAIAGALTCAAALTLFLGEIKSSGAGQLLFVLFGAALVGSIAALGAFTCEMVLAGQAVRERTEDGGH